MHFLHYFRRYSTSKITLQSDLVKMPGAISPKPLTVGAWRCHHWLQGIREPYRQDFIKIKNGRVLGLGRSIVECPGCFSVHFFMFRCLSPSITRLYICAFLCFSFHDVSLRSADTFHVSWRSGGRERYAAAADLRYPFCVTGTWMGVGSILSVWLERG